jgi:diguanylate cyclase (GGDEF)-like protein
LRLQAALIACCALLGVLLGIKDWRHERLHLAGPDASPSQTFRMWVERRAAPFALGSALLLLSVNACQFNQQAVRRLQRERRRALQDPLTRLPNRRAFDRRLQRLAGDRRGATSLLFIDLDRFKVLNDTLGHEAGDAALVGVAAAIRRAVADEDEGLCCRWGGDEFAILLPGADRAKAERVASRVAEALGQVRISVDHRPPIPVRGSIGIATIDQDRLPSHARTGSGHHPSLLGMADAALADAKQAGRQTVRTSSCI